MNSTRVFVAFEVSREYRNWLTTLLEWIHRTCDVRGGFSKAPPHCTIQPPFSFATSGLEGAVSLLESQVRQNIRATSSTPHGFTKFEVPECALVLDLGETDTHSMLLKLCKGVFGLPNGEFEGAAHISILRKLSLTELEKVFDAVSNFPIPTDPFPYNRVVVWVDRGTSWHPFRDFNIPDA